MKKKFQFIVAMMLSLTAYSEVVDLVILQTTDIHGHLSYTDSAQEHGDWLRLATLIKEERKSAGGASKSLLIDCGDTTQGTLIAALSKGEASVLMLDALGYDAWIPGNHELDFGVSRLKELLMMCKTPFISGNLGIQGMPTLPSYRLYQKAGAKIVVIGMNAFLLDFWVWGEKMKGFNIGKAAIAIEKVLPEVMELNPDMIIVALHQGLIEQGRRAANEVKSLAYRFPQIDLILGGHTHREFAGKKVGNTWYVQGGKHAEFLAKVTAKIDTKQHCVLDIRSQLVASADYPPDLVCSTILQPWLKQARAFASKPVCYIDRAIGSSGMPGLDCQMSEIICRAISWATGVPVVFHGKLTETSWAKDSYLTEEKLFETIPYENGIGKAELTIDELNEIIKEQLKFKGTKSFNGIYGLITEISLNGVYSDPKVISQQPLLQKEKRIPVAFNSYTIAGAGGRFPKLREILRRPASNLVDLETNTRDILRNFLMHSDQWEMLPTPWFRLKKSEN